MTTAVTVQNQNPVQAALETIQDPEAKNLLSMVVAQNIAVLGEDEAFLMRDKNGEIRAFKQRCSLSLRDGTLVQPTPGTNVISAQGYEKWAEAAGACVIFPKEVLVGQDWMPNPFAERDPNNRRILAVHARAVAFRFSSKGLPIISDWTTIFDTPSYRLIDLLAKAKKFPQAFRLLPAELKPEDPGTWASYPFDESTNLFVNTSHDEALTWFSQILNREKKSMDFAQTFAKRNALKHLSGLQKVPGNGSEWNLSVLCWRPTAGNIIKWDASEYVNLQKRVGSLIDGNGSEFEQIEYQSGKEAVSDEQGFAATEAEIDPEDQEPIDIESGEAEPTPGPEPQQQQVPSAESKIMMQFRQIQKMFPKETAQTIADLKISGTPNEVQAVLISKKVNEILDSQA